GLFEISGFLVGGQNTILFKDPISYAVFCLKKKTRARRPAPARRRHRDGRSPSRRRSPPRWLAPRTPVRRGGRVRRRGRTTPPATRPRPTPVPTVRLAHR